MADASRPPRRAALPRGGAPIRLTRGFAGDKAGQRRVGLSLQRHLDDCAAHDGPCPTFEGSFGATWTFAFVPALAVVAGGGMLVATGLRVTVGFDARHRLIRIRRRRWPLRPWDQAFEVEDWIDVRAAVDGRGHGSVEAVRGDGTRTALFRSFDPDRDAARVRAWSRAMDAARLATPSSERGRR